MRTRFAAITGAALASLLTITLVGAPNSYADDGPTDDDVKPAIEVSGSFETETSGGTASRIEGEPTPFVRNSNPPDCSDSQTVWFWEAPRSNPKQVTLGCATGNFPDWSPRVTGMSVEYTAQYGIWPGMAGCANPMAQDGYNPPLGSEWTIGIRVNQSGRWEQVGTQQYLIKPAVPPDPGTPDLDEDDPRYRPPTPGQPAVFGTEYKYVPRVTRSMTCYDYTAPTWKTTMCPQAGSVQIMGPYNTDGDPMTPASQGGTLTRKPGPGNEESEIGQVRTAESDLGKTLSNPRSQTASKANVEKECLSGPALTLRLTDAEALNDYGRYYMPWNIVYAQTKWLDFVSWGTNNTVLRNLWPKYYDKAGWFQTPGYYPHYIESVDRVSLNMKRYFNIFCQKPSSAPLITFVGVVSAGGGWQGGNWAPLEPLGAETYSNACADDGEIPPDCNNVDGPCQSSSTVRVDDLMRCEPSTGTEFKVNRKAAAPIEFADPDRFNSRDVFEANATGTPYFVRWERPKVVLSSNGRDVTEIPNSDPVWRVRYDLTPSSSPILIKNPVTGRDVDNVNDRNQPYHLWADRTPDSVNNRPTPTTQWDPLSWSGNPMSVPLDEWSEREANQWPDETRALWLKFFQATTAGRYGWQLTPVWEVTASVPVAGRTPIFQNFTANGYWIPSYGGETTEIRRESYTCPGQRLNVNVTRSVDLFR